MDRQRSRSRSRWTVLQATVGACLLASTPAIAQGRGNPPPVAFTARDDGRVVRLPVGAELTVSLAENAGTPYRWVLRDSNRIRSIGKPAVKNVAPPGIVGGRLIRTFRLQIVAGGRIPLRFALRSMVGDKRASTAQRFDLTIDADTMSYIPTDYGSDDRRLTSLNERDANGVVSSRLGDPIEIHLSAEPSTGYRWEVLSSRNIAFERPIGVEYKPGILGFGAGPETVVRLHTTVDRSDGFLDLVYMPPGERPDPDRAVRQLSYQFHNRS